MGHPLKQLAVLAALAGAAAFLPATLEAQRQSVRGVVRDTSGAPLEGAELVLGDRSTLTDGLGQFRFDGLAPGRYTLVVRNLGYLPVRSRAIVVPEEPTELEFFMVPDDVRLPEIVVVADRLGIHGTVGDSGYHAAVGARVQVLGAGGGEVLTDSLGRFAFPEANKGTFVVRITMPGYGERRIPVELVDRGGRELAVRLLPATARPANRFAELALEQLSLRLATSFRRQLVGRDELARYGSLALCNLPRVSRVAGTDPTIIVNGETVLRGVSLCAWQIDEIDLVEVGVEVCADASTTIAELLGVYCSGTTRSVPAAARSVYGAGSVGRGGGFVVIWEKK
ncbi:MAG: carboxypeptidase regulatory-like domain-containing protein [Gemmatimonadales bacterium]